MINVSVENFIVSVFQSEVRLPFAQLAIYQVGFDFDFDALSDVLLFVC